MKTIRTFPEVEAAAAAFAALGSEQRLSVLRTLVRAGPTGLAMGDLGARCGITGSTLSFHVRILVQAGLVNQTRDGRRILCAARMPALTHLGDFLTAGCCADLVQETEHNG
ncbi:MAG: helix-turn-helix transcriptional regulator [Rhodobacteraceae bacterium]|nr:helix-turn-helix transcriptional regulator [Paracoccaceae bacterium]